MWNRRDEVFGDVGFALERNRDREAGKPKRSVAANAPTGPPLAEDNGSEGYVAPPARHILGEAPYEADREEGAAQRGEDARGDDGRVANAVDRDSDGVGRLRVLAHGTNPEADGSLEENDVRQDDGGKHQPHKQVEVPEDTFEKASDPRDVAQEAQVRIRYRETFSWSTRQGRSSCTGSR